VQTAKIFTFSFKAGQTMTCTYWTYDWGTFDAFQAAPSLNQGFNAGVVSVTQVKATMPVENVNSPALFYTILVKNEGDPSLNPNEVTMCDVYNAWQ
jgi:hypothetical protein